MVALVMELVTTQLPNVSVIHLGHQTIVVKNSFVPARATTVVFVLLGSASVRTDGLVLHVIPKYAPNQ